MPTPEDAIQGASDIVAEIVSDSADFRAYLRKKMWNEGFIQAELTGDEEVQHSSCNTQNMLNRFVKCRLTVSWRLIRG